MLRIKVSRPGVDADDHLFSGSSIVIGRSRACDITLREMRGLSRRHCRISLEGSACEVLDLSSKNGLDVNGVASIRTTMHVGDVIRIAEARIELIAYGPDEPVAKTGGPVEEVRPCLECGFLIPVDDLACPKCSGSVTLKRRTRIDPHHLKGFRLVRKIGSGGMGIVFEATRSGDDEHVAVKILKPHLAKDPRYLVRFVEEMRVLTVLEHPAIVRIIDRGSDGGLSYIVMELIEGESVRHMIRREGAMSELKALSFAQTLINALDYAARRRVVHGDVKPSNFLIDHTGRVKLCDFGLARLFELTSMGGPMFSPESSGRKGTAAYAAPERFLPDSKPTVPADIYSMGVSVFQMLTGELPFGSNRQIKRLDDPTARGPMPDPSLFNPEIRPATHMLLERMTRPTASDRYQTWLEVQEDLALLLGS